MEPWENIEVDLRPNGRAILTRPGSGFIVEIQWVSRERRGGGDSIQSVTIVPDEADLAEVLDNINIPAYIAAFYERLTGQGVPRSFHRVPRKRPASGSLDPDFYRRLIAVYDDLVRDGWKDPAKELARRMDANHSTVKSWLKRGREYLDEKGA